MADAKETMLGLFAANQLTIPANRQKFFDAFVAREENKKQLNVIVDLQNQLMDKWKRESKVMDILQQPVRILNATVGKPYEARFDFEKNRWNDITDYTFEGLGELGLSYDQHNKQITGIPLSPGEFTFVFKFKTTGDDAGSPYHEKPLNLIINPDPRTLWKNLESDTNDPYWKEDDRTIFEPLGDRHLLVSSKRGRSHANTGAFREDDFAFATLDAGWSLVVISDGAGSAKISRKGSSLACNAVVAYFEENVNTDSMMAFDDLVQQHKKEPGSNSQQQLNHQVYNLLGKAAFYVHKQLAAFASSEAVPLKDLHCTLAFALFKKYELGYAFLTFGVGDCPIALLDKQVTKVTPMNWLDVGDFGGGTRFITMPEIFQHEKFASRFGFKLVDDFSYLIMMSDGIYDAKFVVETNLENVKKWKEFLADLAGKNEEGTKVDLDPENKDIISQFSAWMDFWSPGNHDDRTLAIVF